MKIMLYVFFLSYCNKNNNKYYFLIFTYTFSYFLIIKIQTGDGEKIYWYSVLSKEGF